MNQKIKKIIIFWGILCVFFLKADFISALEIHYPDILGHSINDTSTFAEFICYFFSLGTDLAIFLSLIVIAVGGIYYLIDYGRGKFTSEAKDWIKSGIVGLIIVILAALIAYTINPALTACKVDFLPNINFNFFNSSSLPPGVGVTSFKEIPIGTLTENLLTRTTDCYGFDQMGNPVAGDRITTDSNQIINAPTYLNHDRADCLLQLADGAQKKTQVIAALSDEITKLMDKCDCQKYGNCSNSCNNDGKGCKQPTKCYAGQQCSGKCVGAACNLPSSSGPKDCCPTGVKDQAEHGPIDVYLNFTTDAGLTLNPSSLSLTWNTAGGQSATVSISGKGGYYVKDNSNSNIASVRISGSSATVTAKKGASANGTTNITICQSGDQCATLDVTVSFSATPPLSLSQNSLSISPAQVATVSVSGNGHYYISNISNLNIVSIRINGNSIIITGARVGTTNITVCQSGNQCAVLNVTVSEITIDPSALSLTIDQRGTASINGNGSYYISGNSNSNIASAQISGNSVLVSAKNNGATNITVCQSGDQCVTLSVIVSGKCTTPTVQFKGLDEFRCPNPIKGGHSSCDDIESFIEKKFQVNNKSITIIDPVKWNQLNLMQQLKYFQIKIDEIKKTIQNDADVLNQARITLGKCYLATPYIDLLKTYESTDQQNHIILKDPETFSDPQTRKPIDVSKYCSGFNYANSTCLNKCNNMCPDTSQQAMQLYSACTNPNNREACIENAYNSRPCIYGGNTSQKFSDCINSCQNDCVNNCSKKYLPCSDEYNLCKTRCDGNSQDGNSQCVLNNASQCLFGAKGFNDCSTKTTDQGNNDYCINNAYLCKNGSDEYAGYPDCASSSSNYSSSYLFANPSSQKCPNFYGPALPNSICSSTTNSSATCQEICPETTKCLSASKCPSCPCDQITDPKDPSKPLTINFLMPNISISDKKSPVYNNGNEGYTTQKQKISAYEMVGPQCNGYSYNDDPLTFYCEDNWWNNPNKDVGQKPMGTEKIAPASEEIPVGQTVDNAENWASSLISTASSLIGKMGTPENPATTNIQAVIDLMTKAGNAYETSPIQDYCKCNARKETGDPICTTGCKYNQQTVPGAGLKCSCDYVPCSGSPCQQVTDYLSQLWNSYRQLKSNFKDFYVKMIQEPRSDIIKELAYSRKSINDCSVKNNNYGSNNRLLSCTRVKDELISPVGKSCYQKNLGNIFDPGIRTDNWFCAQEYSKNPAGSNNPIYNTQK